MVKANIKYLRSGHSFVCRKRNNLMRESVLGLDLGVGLVLLVLIRDAFSGITACTALLNVNDSRKKLVGQIFVLTMMQSCTKMLF